MSKLTKAQVNSTIRKMAAAQTIVFEMQQKLYAHCDLVYGCTPSGIDNDQFIDSCLGGSGSAKGMTADEFHKSMIESMRIQGVEMIDGRAW